MNPHMDHQKIFSVNASIPVFRIRIVDDFFQPFDELTWNELWEFASHMYPEGKSEFRAISATEQLPDEPHPTPPPLSIAKRGSIEEYLAKGWLCA